MLTADMKRIIEEQLLGFVATTAVDGTPNVSPKGTFFVVDDKTIAFGEIRSPGTIRNLRANPRIEINFVDPFVRKGYRFGGTALVLERGTDAFETLLGRYHGTLAARLRAIVAITVTKALALTSPVYDDGAVEADIRRGWTNPLPQAAAGPTVHRMMLAEPQRRIEFGSIRPAERAHANLLMSHLTNSSTGEGFGLSPPPVEAVPPCTADSSSAFNSRSSCIC
jgi:hypothetical protein